MGEGISGEQLCTHLNCEGPRLGLKAIKTVRTNGITSNFSVV